MRLIKGSRFAKNHFQSGSRPSKSELIQALDSGELPGRIINGTPYIDENQFIGAGVRFKIPDAPVQKLSGASLLE